MPEVFKVQYCNKCMFSINLLFSLNTCINNHLNIFSVIEAPTRNSNYVYQVLMETYEGKFLIAAYDYEQIEGNYDTLLAEKKTTYFFKSKVARLIISHEFRRTNTRS